MMTAYDLDECIQQGIGYDIGAYLSKPVDVERLQITLSELFAARASDAGDYIPSTDVAELVTRLPSFLQGRRVLLVEDNEINREIAVELLQDAGLIVDCAENGRIACEMLETPELIYAAALMDVQMPEMDGVSATRRIRQTWSADILPIIAMTAHAYEEDRQRCLDAGMNDHVSKPIDPPVLITALEKWLQHGNPVRTPYRSLPDSERAVLPDVLWPFDLAAALLRVNGKRAVLRRLILGFRSTYADVCGRLAALHEAGAANDAARLAHNLRGVAASLELPEVAVVARQLEECLQTGSDDLMTGLLLRLDDAIRPAIAAADHLAETATDDPVAATRFSGGGVVDLLEVQHAREALRDQISRHSLSARRGFENFADAMGMTAQERGSDPMGAAIRGLDYAEALALLDSQYATHGPIRSEKSA